MIEHLAFGDQPHRRYDPLTGRWIVVSVGRTQRPWQGAQEATRGHDRPAYDPDCYLCPRNLRANGERNPDYRTTYAFTNDYAALHPDTEDRALENHPLLRAHAQPGTCRVLCFSPRHDLTLAGMDVDQFRAVVELWVEQYAKLSATYRWVQIFENKGESMGASNPHPHGQIWASTTLPTEPASEDQHQRAYLEQHGSPLLVDYAALESERDERVVAANDGWVAVVPFWAAWPFETLLLPRRHVSRLTDLEPAEHLQLVEVMQALLRRYDGLFDHPFPYSMGWHGAPGTHDVGSGAGRAGAAGDPGRDDTRHWQLHAHFYPPLLRSPTVRKWMVGYEMLADQQRDFSPEEAAGRLRAATRASAGRPDPVG